MSKLRYPTNSVLCAALLCLPLATGCASNEESAAALEQLARALNPCVHPGAWIDSHGHELWLAVDGPNVQVDPRSDTVREYWTEGSGSLQDGVLVMEHKKDGRIIDVQRGTIAAEKNEITWTNGTVWRTKT